MTSGTSRRRDPDAILPRLPSGTSGITVIGQIVVKLGRPGYSGSVGIPFFCGVSLDRVTMTTNVTNGMSLTLRKDSNMKTRVLLTLIAVLLSVSVTRTGRGQTSSDFPNAASRASGVSSGPAVPDSPRRPPTAPFGEIRLINFVGSGGTDELKPTEHKKCETDDCCPPFWAHRTGAFGEYLLLRPRDAEIAVAVPFDGPITQTRNDIVQVGPVMLVDPDYSSGFRAGVSWAWDDCTSLVATYSFFESQTGNAVEVDAPLVLRSLVAHPGTDVPPNYLAGAAGLEIDFRIVDLDYRSIWWASDRGVVNWSIGGRYVNLTQDFAAQFGGTGTLDDVVTAVNFDGGGLRFGLDGERHHRSHGFLLYGKSAMSLVAGEFRSSFFQGSDVDPVIVDTAWKAGRVVPIFDVELGAGWQSSCGHFRLTAGYMFSMWFNTLTTDSWIRSVHQNNFVGHADAISYDTLTFDGFTARAEYRF